MTSCLRKLRRPPPSTRLRHSPPHPRNPPPRPRQSPPTIRRSPKLPVPLLSSIKSAPDLSFALDLFYSAHPHHQDYPSCSSLLYRLARARNFPELDSLLDFISSQRIRCSDAVFNALIQRYGKLGLPHRAVELFQNIPSFNCSRTPQSLNFLLNALVESGELDSAVDFLRRASPEFYVRPNVVSYNVIMKGMLAKGGISPACDLFDEMLKRGIRPSVVTYNMFIGFFSRNGDLDKAMALKQKMSKVDGVPPNAVTYSLLMEGLCLQGKYDSARKMLFDMEYWGCKPSVVNYGVLMSDLGRKGMIEEAKELMSEMKKKKKCRPDVVTYNILINYMLEGGKVDEAYKVMVEMKIGGCEPSAATYRMIVDGFCKAGEYDKGLGILNAMLVSGHCPRRETLDCLVAGLCESKRLTDACLVLDEMEKRDIGFNVEGWQALVRCLFQECDVGAGLHGELIRIYQE